MSTQTEYFTPEGYEKLKKELHHLKTVERPSISKQIAEAKDKGDLSDDTKAKLTAACQEYAKNYY